MASVQGQQLEKAIASALHRHDFTLIPATFYLGLATGSLPLKTAPLSSIAEVVGTGYGRIALPNNSTVFPSLMVGGTNDWKVTSVPLHFANSGVTDWTPADFAFICDVASGTAGYFFAAATVTPFLLRPDDTYDLTWEAVVIP